MENKIKEIRLKKGLSQEKLALESGKNVIILTSTLTKIANALNTKVEKLFFN